MKNLLLATIASLLFVACTQSGKDDQSGRNIQLLSDSTSYSNSNIYSDSMTTPGSQVESNNQAMEPGNAESVSKKNSEKPRTKIIYIKEAPQKQATNSQPPAVQTPPVVGSTTTKDTASTAAVNTGNTIPDAGTPGKTEEAQAPQKKGLSKEAQGAIIGGAAGAVGGAIISKKKGVGAVIGGIVGAAGGYIIGKNKAKKESDSKDSVKIKN